MEEQKQKVKRPRGRPQVRRDLPLDPVLRYRAIHSQATMRYSRRKRAEGQLDLSLWSRLSEEGRKRTKEGMRARRHLDRQWFATLKPLMKLTERLAGTSDGPTVFNTLIKALTIGLASIKEQQATRNDNDR
jgi:hypothetical protein